MLAVKLLSESAKLPTRNIETDAGLDIYSDVDLFIPIGETHKVVTNIAVNVPIGYVGKIEDRSSMALKGLRTGAGIIDSGFQGNLSVVLHNFSNKEVSMNGWPSFGKAGYQIKKGDKIAQILLYRVELWAVKQVTEFPTTKRSDRGFGSSGR